MVQVAIREDEERELRALRRTDERMEDVKREPWEREKCEERQSGDYD